MRHFYLYLYETLTGELIKKMTSAGAEIESIHYIDGHYWAIMQCEDPIVRLKTYKAVGAQRFNGDWVVGNGVDCHCSVNPNIKG